MSRIRMLALVCLLLPVLAHAQAYQPLINPHAQYLDVNGKPLANGKVYTYQAGTTTKAATYKDSAGATSNSNPVITDSAGFATIYLDISKSYKIVLQNAQGVQQWVADNVTGGVPTGGGGGTYPAAGIANSTGSAWGTSYSSTNTIPANFISILNQSTTGNAATASALATAPSICPSGQFAQGILATGNATGCAASAGMVWPPPSASGVIPAFNGAGGWLTSYNNANPIPANFISTLNQNTTGTAANITATSNSTLTTLSVLALPYSQLSGTVPTWNQSTTGNAATATGMSTSGTANQVWGMDSTGSTQGWQTSSAGGGVLTGTSLQLNGATSGNFTMTPSATSNTVTLGGTGYTSLLTPTGSATAVAIGPAVNTGFYFAGNNINYAIGGSAYFTMGSGFVKCTNTCVWSGNLAGAAQTFQSGVDAATAGAVSGVATFKSASVLSGATTASGTGNATLQSGDNGATGGAAQSVGNVTVSSGGFTGASGASTAWTPGYVTVQQKYWADTTVTTGTLACFTTPGTSGQMPKVGTCTATSNVPWLGIITGTQGQSVLVAKSGHAGVVVSNASATDTAGYFVCVDTTNAGKVTVGTTVCGAGLGVGFIDTTGSGTTSHSVDVERY